MAQAWIDRSKIKKIDVKNFKGGMTGRNVYTMYKPDYLINLALYDTNTGINIVFMEDENVKSGYLFSSDGIGIRGDKELVWVTKEQAYSALEIRDYFSFSPTLTKNNVTNIDWGNKHSTQLEGYRKRSLIGYNDGYLILCVTDNYVTIEKEADIATNNLYFKYGGNVDGGGSCYLQVNGKILKDSTRANASWLCVWMDKRQDFIDIGKSKIGCGYVYGTQGEILTNSLLNSLVKTYGREHYYFVGYSAEKWLGKESFDCSGLIVYILRELGYISKTDDYTAKRIFENLCVRIDKSNLRDTDLVFRGSPITHVGMYLGGKVLHAKGTKYGVVLTDELDTFTKYGRLKYFV